MSDLSRRRFITQSALLGGGLAAGAGLLATSGSGALAQAVAAQSAALAASADPLLAFRSGLELVELIRAKVISSEELTRYFIARIERFDKRLNAIVVRTFDTALDSARAADAALAQGRSLGTLHGLPMTIKESFNLKGTATTWGVPDLANNLADTDSAMVARYRGAGAHFMGKTNVPLMLGDFQSYNDVYGTTNNPWNLERSPGGSSGGSAAALAAGLTGMDSGSDIGGSIRNPAHFCGVYGHKPTWGVVPPQGHATPGVLSTPDLAVVGPMARSAADLAAAMDIVAGPDVMNAAGWHLELPPPRMKSLGELRVALWSDHAIAPVDRQVAERVQRVGEALARRGARVSDTARPEFAGGQSHELYLKLLLAIIGQAPEDNVDHQQWMGLDNARTRLRLGWQAFFRDWDVLVCPIMPTTARPHDHSPQAGRMIEVNGEPVPYMNQVFWAGHATLSYLPSTVFPTGLSDDGLPIGLQAIGPEFGDRTTIEFARLMADELGGFVPPPGYGD